LQCIDIIYCQMDVHKEEINKDFSSFDHHQPSKSGSPFGRPIPWGCLLYSTSVNLILHTLLLSLFHTENIVNILHVLLKPTLSEG